MKELRSSTPNPEPADDTLADPSEQVQPGSDNGVPVEYGGPRGKEPTRYGDWEKNGRCIDF